MKTHTYLLLICSVLLMGCNRTPNPTGIYTSTSGSSYDFRDDRTAVYESRGTTIYPVVGSTTHHSRGMGRWTFEKDRLLFEGPIHLESIFADGTSMSTNLAMKIAFTIEKNGDLITITNAEYREAVRFIKQK